MSPIALEWRQAAGIRWLEASLGESRCAFSTRIGGGSTGPYEGLNLGVHTGDDPGLVAENRGSVAGALGLDALAIAASRQVHGAGVLCHPAEPRGVAWTDPRAERPEGDGHALEAAGAAAVLVADCLPVAVSGPGGVAILHCGWRGLAAGILERGAAVVGAERAAIGPGIGPCCYEVGTEVLAAFAGLGEGIARGRRLDLRAVAVSKLRAAGVEEVEVADLCTACEEGLFYSHRRDGERTGRQAGFVWAAGGMAAG